MGEVATDVLYLMNTYTVTDTRVYTLESLRTQATHGDLKDNAPGSDSDSDFDSDSDSDSDKNDKKKGSDSDSTDSESGEPEYIYDVGINNQVGVVEHSDEDGGANAGGDDYGDDGGNGYEEDYGGGEEEDYE